MKNNVYLTERTLVTLLVVLIILVSIIIIINNYSSNINIIINKLLEIKNSLN